MDHKFPINPDWQRHKFANSQMLEAGYDRKTQTMYVHFKANDTVYTYNPIPETKYNAMVESPSPGTYFHKHFRNKKDIKIKTAKP
jgi:hypothetical protein